LHKEFEEPIINFKCIKGHARQRKKWLEKIEEPKTQGISCICNN